MALDSFKTDSIALHDVLLDVGSETGIGPWRLIQELQNKIGWLILSCPVLLSTPTNSIDEIPASIPSWHLFSSLSASYHDNSPTPKSP